MKKNWKTIVEKFINNWPDKDKIVAAMACGSYVTGSPSNHSDIDLHLILSEDTNWRERGNKIVDGILIEYFANPSKQIESYFKEDYEDSSYSSPTQFLTGEVIFDKIRVIPKLKKLAKYYRNKKFKKLNNTIIELKKYSLWDNLDNLEDSYEKESQCFYYTYYNSLQVIYETYSKYINYPISGTSKVYDTLTKEKSRKKYLLDNYPDKNFVTLFDKAIQLKDKKQMKSNFKSLTEHVLKKMGGFKVDGWKVRSSLSKS